MAYPYAVKNKNKYTDIKANWLKDNVENCRLYILLRINNTTVPIAYINGVIHILFLIKLLRLWLYLLYTLIIWR